MMYAAPRGRIRWTAVALAALCLALVAPAGALAKDEKPKKVKSVKVKSIKTKSVKTKKDKSTQPSGGETELVRHGRGDVNSLYAQRGGNRSDSNPTTVPIVDDDLLFMMAWTRWQIRTDAAHAVTRGGGVVVAVLDGGFNLVQPDIAGRLSWWGYDAIDEDFDPEDLGNGYDDDWDGRVDGGVGHGTFVCGMILTAAPDAILVPIRIRDDEGWGTNKELERGLQYALDLGVHVVNISGGSAHGRSTEATRLIAELRRRGVVVVTSAGNDGADEVSAIGDLEDALSVGAVDAGDRLAPFSNTTRDPTVRMVLAPGVNVYGPLGAPFDESRGYWSGTSFSAALVSGSAALVRSQAPWLRALEVMDRLMETADPAWDETGRLMRFGRINLLNAVTR